MVTVPKSRLFCDSDCAVLSYTRSVLEAQPGLLAWTHSRRTWGLRQGLITTLVWQRRTLGRGVGWTWPCSRGVSAQPGASLSLIQLLVFRKGGGAGPRGRLIPPRPGQALWGVRSCDRRETQSEETAVSPAPMFWAPAFPRLAACACFSGSFS